MTELKSINPWYTYYEALGYKRLYLMHVKWERFFTTLYELAGEADANLVDACKTSTTFAASFHKSQTTIAIDPAIDPSS